MGYCYLMLINIVSESEARNWLGLSIVIAAGVLMSFNIFQLVKIVFHKTKLRYLKLKQTKGIKLLQKKKLE